MMIPSQCNAIARRVTHFGQFNQLRYKAVWHPSFDLINDGSIPPLMNVEIKIVRLHRLSNDANGYEYYLVPDSGRQILPTAS